MTPVVQLRNIQPTKTPREDNIEHRTAIRLGILKGTRTSSLWPNMIDPALKSKAGRIIWRPLLPISPSNKDRRRSNNDTKKPRRTRTATSTHRRRRA
jgi:hypothetical protein